MKEAPVADTAEIPCKRVLRAVIIDVAKAWMPSGVRSEEAPAEDFAARYATPTGTATIKRIAEENASLLKKLFDGTAAVKDKHRLVELKRELEDMKEAKHRRKVLPQVIGRTPPFALVCANMRPPACSSEYSGMKSL